MANRDVVLCSPVRTAIGTYGGTLKDTPAVDLGAVVVRAALERAKLPAGEVDTVVMGNVVQAGNKMNPARQAAIYGGVPVDVPAMTVNRVCGSGAQAIASAAQEVMLGFIDSAVAGGMENMDRAPYLMSSRRWGYRMGDGQIFDAMLMDGLKMRSPASTPDGTPRISRGRTRSRGKSKTAGRSVRRSGFRQRKRPENLQRK
jgi:acetyl-CoA C-acetyltransferase